MKPLFTFLLIFSCLFAKGQYSPETAVRITADHHNIMPFANVPAIAGPNYDCLTNAMNTSWTYFSVCDSVIIELDLQRGSQDSVGYIAYGPLTDTNNISTQLQTAPIAGCASYLINFNGGINIMATKGIYYVMVNNITGNSVSAQLSTSSWVGGLPEPINTFCSVCNEATFLRQRMCTIDLDLTTQRNKLVWEKGDTTNIGGYVIFRENSIFQQYDSLDFVSVNTLSEYLDLSANPAARVWRYKLVAMDVCGNIPLTTSTYDRYTTIFLQQGVGTFNSINLNWNSGINFSPFPGYGSWIQSFYIYRGSAMNTMVLIDSVPSMVYNYTDLNPNPGLNYYQVEMRKSAPCVSSMLPTYTRSGSNFIGTVFTGITEVKPELRFTVQPNPASDHVSVVLNSDANNLTNTISILSIEGKKLGIYPVTSFPQEINTSELSDGIYILQLENEKGVSRQNIVIQ